jgi:hypothetical protein
MTKDQIIHLLRTDKRAIVRALLVLNARQTTDEQVSEHTRYLNGRGFRPCHARMGTSHAKFFQRNGYLTDKQINYWRVTMKDGNMRIGIYWAQLLEEAEKKAMKKEIQNTCQTNGLGEVIVHDVGIRNSSFQSPSVPATEHSIETGTWEIDEFWKKLRPNG